MSQYLVMTAGFLINAALAGRNVSKRRYGWGTAYALTSLWCIAFAVEAMPS